MPLEVLEREMEKLEKRALKLGIAHTTAAGQVGLACNLWVMTV